jgi:hypothetical protein
MADDDIVRRATDYLERAADRVLDEERQPPEVTRRTIDDVDGVEVDCDICEE